MLRYVLPVHVSAAWHRHNPPVQGEGRVEGAGVNPRPLLPRAGAVEEERAIRRRVGQL